MYSLSLFLFSLFFLRVDSLRIGFDSVQKSSSTSCSDSSCDGLVNVKAQDSVYVSNITINGQIFTVQLDTGSSDLWVNASQQPITSAKPVTGPIIVSEVYGDGSNFTGTIATADVEFHGEKVSNQMFVMATEAFKDNVSPLNVSGLIGLSLGGGSPILRGLQQNNIPVSQGKSFLANLFAQNGNDPDFITFKLSRKQDLNTTAEHGAFTVSELEQGFESITNQKQMDIFPAGNTEYTVPIDGVTLNGQGLSLPSTLVTTQSNTKPIGLVDTGSQALLAPSSVVTSIYSAFKDAVTLDTDFWVLPCDKEPPAVAFVLGGQTIPLHPLDVNPISSTYKTSDGSLVSVCFGGIMAQAAVRNRFDFLLGTPLLKNAYALFNFPNPADAVPNGSLKLLAITDPAQASADFAATRKAQLALAPAASMDQLKKIAGGDRSFTRVDAPSIDGQSPSINEPSTGKGSGKGNGASNTKPLSSGSAIVLAALAVLFGTFL